MSRPVPYKEVVAENQWLVARMNLADHYSLALPMPGGNVLPLTLLRIANGIRWAILRHRPMGTQAYIAGTWRDVREVPTAAYVYSVVEAHRLSEQLAAEEAEEHMRWQAKHDAGQDSSELAGAVSA